MPTCEVRARIARLISGPSAQDSLRYSKRPSQLRTFGRADATTDRHRTYVGGPNHFEAGIKPFYQRFHYRKRIWVVVYDSDSNGHGRPFPTFLSLSEMHDAGQVVIEALTKDDLPRTVRYAESQQTAIRHFEDDRRVSYQVRTPDISAYCKGKDKP